MLMFYKNGIPVTSPSEPEIRLALYEILKPAYNNSGLSPAVSIPLNNRSKITANFKVTKEVYGEIIGFHGKTKWKVLLIILRSCYESVNMNIIHQQKKNDFNFCSDLKTFESKLKLIWISASWFNLNLIIHMTA